MSLALRFTLHLSVLALGRTELILNFPLGLFRLDAGGFGYFLLNLDYAYVKILQLYVVSVRDISLPPLSMPATAASDIVLSTAFRPSFTVSVADF